MAKQKDNPSRTPNFLASPEIKASIKRYEQTRDAFDKQLDELRQSSGLSVQEMRKYCENPNNFSKYQWEFLQKEKARFEKIQTEFEKTRDPNRLTNPANKPKKTKRIRGSRQNWIPMQ